MLHSCLLYMCVSLTAVDSRKGKGSRNWAPKCIKYRNVTFRKERKATKVEKNISRHRLPSKPGMSFDIFLCQLPNVLLLTPFLPVQPTHGNTDANQCPAVWSGHARPPTPTFHITLFNTSMFSVI